jgi:serine phosphatase RsbU (regulator of sigma subunit)
LEKASIRIPGFEIGPVLGVGATSVVLRGERAGRAFAIKVLRVDAESTSDEDVSRFRREGAALARLRHPSLVAVHEVSEAGGCPYIVMDLVEGESLAAAVARGPLLERQVLSVGKALASALTEVHRHGLIHRDLKPPNVLIEPSGAFKIIDFGLAVERGEKDASSTIVGTFMYSAPEQLDILARPVDERSDLYSVGAVLFECATGRPPIEATSVADLFEKHLSTRVPDATSLSPTLRPALGRIIAKLLAKDPDDRYQSSEGLLGDLEDIQRLDEAIRRGETPRLGSRDRVARGWELPIAGRDRELAILSRRWEAALEGRGALVQVEGEGGSGKTRLIREIVRKARAADVLVLAGKAQQLERNPLGPLREAIDDHVYRVQKGDAAEQALARIRAAAGEFGAIVRRLSRPLERVLEDAAEVRPLDPASEQARFYEKIADFFAALATQHGAAILHIDDIQWVDDATAAVLKRLSQRLEGAPMLVATTARNDPASAQALTAFLASIGPGVSERIVLEGLDAVAMHTLIAAHLGTAEVGAEIVDAIARRSRGNPFALAEYVRSFVDSGVLGLRDGRWLLDEKRLREVPPPSDVVDLVVGRISQIGALATRFLGIGSVLGFEVDIATLARIVGERTDSVRKTLDEAVRAGLIEIEESTARFIHDRVYEAFSRRLSEEERKQIHQQIAETLDALDDPSPSATFALARHYAGGFPERNPRRVYETSFAAGVLALSSFSNAAAFELLERALELARTLGLDSTELGKVHEQFGIACVRTGRHQRGRESYEAALVAARGEDSARIRYLIGQAHFSEGRNDLAWNEIQQALAALGAGFARGGFTQKLVVTAYTWLVRVLAATGIGFGMSRGAQRKRRQLIAQMHTASEVFAYFLGKRRTMKELAVRELLNTHFLGVSTENAKAHAWQAFVAGLAADKKATEQHGEIAVTMARQIGDREALAAATLIYGYGMEYSGANVLSQKLMKQNLPDVVKYCGASEVAPLVLHITHSMLFQGRSRDVVDWAEEHLELLRRTGGITMQVGVFGAMYSQLTLLGRAREAAEARETQRALAATVPRWVKHARAMVCVNAMMAMLDQSELGAELEERIEEFLALGLEDYHRRLGYMLVAYVRLEQLERAAGEEAQRDALRALERAVDMVVPRSIVPVFQCHASVLEASVRRHRGDPKGAIALLERAEVFAEQAASPWGLWAAARERARSERALGSRRKTMREADAALAIAREEGWIARAEQIRHEFDVTGLHGGDSRRSMSGTQAVDLGDAFGRDRSLDAILRVSLASAQTFDPMEQSRAALDELVSVLGAERGALFVADGDDGALTLRAARAGGRDIEITGYSHTVVDKVHLEREPVILTGTDQGAVLGSESVVAHDLRSIIAGPLLLRDKLLGVVYLDSRVAKGLFRASHLATLRAICNHIAIAMDSARLARVESQRELLEKDFALTAAVQKFFLPKSLSFENEAVQMCGFYKPAGHCSGDWLWYEREGLGAYIMLADVTGHGAASAMLTAFLATYHRACVEHTRGALSRGQAISDMSRALIDVTSGEYLAALSAIEIRPEQRVLRWWFAGAPPLMWMSRDGRVETIAKASSPVGSAPDVVPASGERAVAEGDRIFVFTDGAYEIVNGQGRMIGLRGLSRILRTTHGLPLEDATRQIWREIETQLEGRPLEDDVTFALIDVKRLPG